MDNQPNCCLIVGPSGCGKTHKLLDILTHEYGGHFDFIIILCPTLWLNQTYLNWKYLESDPDVIGLGVPPDQLNLILSYIVKAYSGSATAIVIDDMSNASTQHSNTGMLTYLAYSGRHHNFSLFIISQKLNSIATGIRDNATRVVFFKSHNKRSLKTLSEEFLGCASDESYLLKSLSNGEYMDVQLSGANPTYKVY